MTVDIYKLMINILIDCQIMTLRADMDNCFNMYVFLACGGRQLGHHQQFTVQKLNAVRTRLGLTDCSRSLHSPAQPLPFDHINRCSRTHLPVFSYHLESNIKRGRELELLIKSEKYGRRRGERER